jgi:hypothetical protein
VALSSEPEPDDKKPAENSNELGEQSRNYLISTYRYLRLAIVAVVVTLAVSIGLERSAATCWNSSISAYYYTPVHSIFVAALGLIGVALFVIRGGSCKEEVLLNGAGFLAPVVAFVPTAWSSDYCPSDLTGAQKQTIGQLLNGGQFLAPLSTNNLKAFVIGGLIAVCVTAIVTRSLGKKPKPVPPKEVTVPALGSGAVVIAGLIWDSHWQANFSTHAHSYAAILMFVLVGGVVIFTALRNPSLRWRVLYFACAGAMVLGGGAVFLTGRLMTWHHEVLVLEIVELSAFLLFWFFQTVQLWDVGLRADGWQAVSDG